MFIDKNLAVQLTIWLKWIFICILLPASSLASISDIDGIDVSADYQKISNAYYVLLDPTAKLTLNDVLQEEIASRFEKLSGVVPSYGHISDAVWFRFVLKNDTDKPLERIVQIGVPWMDYISLYFLGPTGDIRKYYHSDLLPFSNRAIKHNLPIFVTRLKPGKTTVLMRVQSIDAIMAPMSIWEPAAWKHQDRWYNLFYGGLYGAVIVMILYNALLFLFLRIPAYFFYICYLTTFLISNFSYNGFIYEFLWPDHPLWLHWLDSTMMYLFPVFGILFVISLLATKETSPRVHLFLLGFLTVLITSFIATALIGGYALHTVSSIVFLCFYAFISVVVGIISWLQGNRVARFFVFASLSGLIGVCLTASMALGFFPFSSMNYHAVELGMLIDMTLLSMALADRYNILRDQKELAEHRYLKAVKASKDNLEKEVARQTKELHHAIEKAEMAARTDELTGISNRRAFYEASKNAFNLARRYRHPVSVIILDIDKFKDINDSYGHAIGDIVLKMVARAIHKTVRKTDISGRIGGEEFALLLPQTTLKTAADLAEKLRTIIGQISVSPGDKKFFCSASLGVCQMEATDQSIDDLIARADRAMYAAKSSGRDRVVQHEGNTNIHPLSQFG